MPIASEESDWSRPTRSFIYGADKTKKTLWSAKAAEAGFNVILIDGDDGSSIIRQKDSATGKPLISLEARKRILVVDVVNTPDKNSFVRFMATFMRQDPNQPVFIWDEQEKVSLPTTFKQNPSHSYIRFEPRKLNMNDVVVIDSWTALAQSTLLEWARENDIDLTSVEKEGDQFSLLNYQSRFLDYTLNKIKTFPCHIICIGHETVYEKWEGKGGLRRMVEQITQPFSSTGPHAKKIGAHFSNYLRFKRLSDIAFQIDAGGSDKQAGGSRQLEPKTYKWEDITPATIFHAVGSKATGEACLGAVFIPKGVNGQIYKDTPQEIPNMNIGTLHPEPQKMPAQVPVVKAGSLASRIALSKQQPT